MANLILTPKTGSFGALGNLPVADVSTTCPAINPAFYTANIPPMSPAVSLNQYLIIKMSLQNAVGATVRTVRLLKANGTVLFTFPAVSQPALPSQSTTLFSDRLVVTNAADWVDITIQVSSGTAGDVVTIKQDSILFAFAESCNITDEVLVKRNVENIYFISMQSLQEGILGKVGSASATSFLAVPVNGLVSGFQWSTNSGNTLYSWNGSSIGIGT
jgi:hypothetical protein